MTNTWGGTVRYTYDAKNRLTAITDPTFGAFTFAYDPMDRRTSLLYPNGVTTSYAYDQAYRMTALATKDASGNVLDGWSYTYDAVGNRLSKTDMTGASETYAFDEVDRLTQAVYPNGTRESFTYDPVGNRLTRTDQSGTTTSSYDVANQMLSSGSTSFTYDANGSLVTKTPATGNPTTTTYDAANRLAQISGPEGTESNLYAPDGTRIEITSPTVGGTVRPLYDLSGNPILEATTGNTLWIYRLYGPGIDEPLAEYRSQGGQVAYLHRDGLGSITLGTNTSSQPVYRQSYTAFGARTVSNVASGVLPSRLSFTSRENSLGSLMQYRSRYYDTSTGRFLSQDSYRGNETSPPSLHRYTYVYNNPINYMDPTGLDAGPIGPGGWEAAVVLIAVLMVVAFAYFVSCLANPKIAGGRLGCMLRILGFFGVARPLIFWTAVIAAILGSVADIAAGWFDGTFDDYAALLLLFSVILATATVLEMGDLWPRSEENAVVRGLAIAWVWILLNWAMRQEKAWLAKQHPGTP